jgi:3-hydroxymyristoyl/3-hydroxydecanoyl-(acyl carrier protein) dehydratase
VIHPDRDVLEIAAAAGLVTGRVRIPEGSPCFDGHFPGAPLLPGVAQLRLVADLVADAYDTPVRVRAIRRVKFSSPIHPGAVVSFRIEAAPGSPRLVWKLGDVRAEVSSGEMDVTVGSP